MDGKMKMEEHLIEELQLNGLGYRSIFENTGTVMLIVEEDMTISMANNEFEQLTGYKREEIEGKKKWIDFVHPSDLKGMIERHKLRRSDSNRAVRNYEFQLVHRDGSIRNILLTVDLIPKTKRSIASLLDITERKRAEDNLRASEKKYRDIFENAMEGIFQTTPDGHLLSANPALARMAGYGSPREMIDYVKNLGVQLYMNPDDRKHMIQMLAECGRLEGFEAQLYRKDGTPFWVSINIRTVRDAEGNIQYFEGTNTDITLRKRTEQELRHKHEQLSAAYQQLVAYDEEIRRKLEEHTQNQKALRASEEKYRILAENASDIIWSMDMDLQFTYVSPSAERLQGWTMEEWKSLRLEDVLTPASLEKVKKALEEELALEDTPGNGPTHARTIETEEYCKNGSTIHQEMTARFLRDPQGKPVGIMGVSRDIGERRRAQDALRESEARFRTLFDKNPYGIAIARNDMTLYVNNSCVRIFGYDDQSEIVGRPQLDGVAPASRAYIAEIIAKRNRGEPVPGIYEVVGIRKDGTEFPVRAQTVEI
jgi:PAS domain S-box-containing protein